MPSKTVYCPHCNCKRELTEIDEAYMHGEFLDSFSLDELPPSIICRGCGGRIDMTKMLWGEYDKKNISKKGSSTGCVVILFAIFVIASLIFCL